jgi:3',5'-cyclic AMP phosphodiesterase CpdA
LLASLNVDVVLITGDFSSTSLDEEFEEGKKFIQSFKDLDLLTYFLPGNHDSYTKKIDKERRFFNFLTSSELRTKRVECHALKSGWWYVGIDCAVATPFFCSYGIFSEEMEKELFHTLSALPNTDRVIICNHFPLFSTQRTLHDLKRADALQKLLQRFPQVVLYLHGHDHKSYIIDKQHEGLPLTLNSGSCAHRPDGTFFIVDLFEKECLVQQLLFSHGKADATWSIYSQKHYNLKTQNSGC